jgi:divalent metal cation (Fe/Co/Zn/Cd) transporter
VTAPDRGRLLRRALELSALSIALGAVAGGVAVVVGLATGRLSLLGFGFDAVVDSAASVVLVWRFRIETSRPHHAERAEQIAERVVSAVLLVLAVYLGWGAVQALATGARPAATEVGIVISLVSIVALPPLAIAKRRVANALGSGALRADSLLTGIAALLAGLSLASFGLTEWLGISGADAVGGLIVAAVLAREGISAFRP